jgi:cysteine desulfurase
VFTAGGTEADNLAVIGAAHAARTARGARGRVVTTAFEHKGVLAPAARLAAEGHDVRYVGVGSDGIVDLDRLAGVLDPSTALVSVMLVNNEVGTVQPLDEVAALVRDRSPHAVLHTDAAQALCWIDLAPAVAVADLVTLASHKCGGPKGTGALLVRPGVPLSSQTLGGGQERDRRSGTQDVAGAVGFAVAAQAAQAERAELVARVTTWRDELFDALTAVPGAAASASSDGDRQHLVPGVVNVCFPEVDSEALLFLLEQEHRVLASAASSCASGAQGPSHVLSAMGLPPALSQGSLRLSMGWPTTAEDVAHAVAVVPAVVEHLQRHARDGGPA